MIHKKGFTLIEMVMVFVVIGVLLGLFMTGSNVMSSAKDRKELLRVNKIKNAVAIVRTNSLSGDLRDVLGYDNSTLAYLGYKLDYMYSTGLLTKSDMLLESSLLPKTPETNKQRFAIVPCEFLNIDSDNLTNSSNSIFTVFLDTDNDSMRIKDSCLQIHLNDIDPLATEFQAAILGEVQGAKGLVSHITCLYEKAYDDKDTRAGSGRLSGRNASTGSVTTVENLYITDKDCSFGDNSNYYYFLL